MIVELLAWHGVTRHQGFGALIALAGGGQLGLALGHSGFGRGFLAFALGDQGLRREDGILALAKLRPRLVELRLQYLGVHARQDLAGLNEIAFVDEDLQHSARALGGHVDLGGFDAPVARREALAQAAGA